MGTPLTYTSVLVFTMALGIAVDDTIHLVFRYRRERREARPNLDAVRNAYRAVGPAMLTTTTIFTLGFASLWVSDIPQHHSLALLCAVAMVLALVGDLLILPALLIASERDG
jgi:predicted RND superfamily exporter protein